VTSGTVSLLDPNDKAPLRKAEIQNDGSFSFNYVVNGTYLVSIEPAAVRTGGKSAIPCHKDKKTIVQALTGDTITVTLDSALRYKDYTSHSLYIRLDANFNFQGDFGVQIRMNERVELRVDPVVYFHVSNGYFAASNLASTNWAGRSGSATISGNRAGRGWLLRAPRGAPTTYASVAGSRGDPPRREPSSSPASVTSMGGAGPTQN
jgi:hypothetical protein